MSCDNFFLLDTKGEITGSSSMTYLQKKYVWYNLNYSDSRVVQYMGVCCLQSIYHPQQELL